MLHSIIFTILFQAISGYKQRGQRSTNLHQLTVVQGINCQENGVADLGQMGQQQWQQLKHQNMLQYDDISHCKATSLRWGDTHDCNGVGNGTWGNRNGRTETISEIASRLMGRAYLNQKQRMLLMSQMPIIWNLDRCYWQRQNLSQFVGGQHGSLHRIQSSVAIT